MPIDEQLRVAVAAVREASRVCRKVQINLIEAGTMHKDDRSPVTVADYASQAVVCRALRKAFADQAIVGEEDAGALRQDTEEALTLRASIAQYAGLSIDDALDAIDLGNGEAQSGAGEAFWTLDPIDGTKGFLRGEQYAIALALIERGRVTLGVLGCPNLGQAGVLMVATRGGGTQRLPLDGRSLEGEPVRVSETASVGDARLCESVESGHSDQSASAAIASELGITAEPYRIDSQCKYAAVGQGDAEIYLRLPTRPGYREKIWDHAAGTIVVEEAGGTVTDVAGQPLDFSKGRQLEDNRGVIATNGPFHARVIEAVGRHVAAAG